MGYEKQKFTFAQAVPISIDYVKYVVVETFNALKGMIFGGAGTGDLMGVVGTINVMSEGVRQGFEMVLRLAVLISINVALINILPLPALDGGKLVFLLLEAVRRKPVDPNKEGFVHMVGFAMFGILARYSDILKIL
jgi:regulator of sigma E protease